MTRYSLRVILKKHAAVDFTYRSAEFYESLCNRIDRKHERREFQPMLETTKLSRTKMSELEARN